MKRFEDNRGRRDEMKRRIKGKEELYKRKEDKYNG